MTPTEDLDHAARASELTTVIPSPSASSGEHLPPTTLQRTSRRLVWFASNVLLGFVAFILFLAGAGAAYEAIASSQDGVRYPPPGRLVDVGGYRVHLECTGHGSPTVLLDAGGGGFSTHWTLVQPEVARTTRVCAWDRAGSGWSDLGSHAHTPQSYTDELHALLLAAGIEGPYVLVAHSYGGRVARLYTSQHPEDVVGLVLVDAVHEDAFVAAEAPSAVQLQMFAGTNWVLSRLGIGRLLGPSFVLLFDPVGARLPEATRELIGVLALRPKNVEGNARLAAGQMRDDERLRSAGTLGARPLVVLTSTEESAQVARWSAAQQKLLALSSDSTQIVAEGSHLIAWQHPELVISAIEQVVLASATPGK
jgi:pimeloyl-ACP methyl ester carboxylesterase